MTSENVTLIDWQVKSYLVIQDFGFLRVSHPIFCNKG
jgi:hypothetical protein